MDESKLFICRKTGMMRPQAEHTRQAAPASTIIRPKQTSRKTQHDHRRKHDNYRSRRDAWEDKHDHERYDNAHVEAQWDTDISISSDSDAG